MGDLSIVFLYYGIIAVLLLIILSGFAGWKVLPVAVFWPVLALVITVGLLTSWFFKDLEDR